MKKRNSGSVFSANQCTGSSLGCSSICKKNLNNIIIVIWRIKRKFYSFADLPAAVAKKYQEHLEGLKALQVKNSMKREPELDDSSRKFIVVINDKIAEAQKVQVWNKKQKTLMEADASRIEILRSSGKEDEAKRLEEAVKRGRVELEFTQSLNQGAVTELTDLSSKVTAGFSMRSDFFSLEAYKHIFRQIFDRRDMKSHCSQVFSPIQLEADAIKGKIAYDGDRDQMILTLPKHQMLAAPVGELLGNCFRDRGECGNVPLVIDEIDGAQMTLFFEGSRLKACVWWYFSQPDNGRVITISWIEQGSRPECRGKERNAEMREQFDLIVSYL
jgi:uncharacterized protein YifE (UPF0438 family)